MLRPVESDVEHAAVAWLEGLGWTRKYSPEIARGEVTTGSGDSSKQRQRSRRGQRRCFSFARFPVHDDSGAGGPIRITGG